MSVTSGYASMPDVTVDNFFAEIRKEVSHKMLVAANIA